jgi:predicted transglutaminase-like cysteine proteinase
MILISLQPFQAKKLLLLVAAILGLCSAACFAQSNYMTVSSTPYDHQMTRIHSVLTSKSASHKDLSVGLVNQWIGDLRAIPYGFSPEWKTPSEVQSGPVADCKGKAVALYQRMQASGADNLRLVIGKRTSMSRRTHAWLEWNLAGATYVLDPTINWTACRSNSFGTHNYIPLYAYAGARKYRAAAGTLFAKN